MALLRRGSADAEPAAEAPPREGWHARVREVLRTPRKTFLAGLGIALVGFGVGYLVSTFVIFPSEGTPGDIVTVPRLTGEDREEARRLLERQRLHYREAESLHHPAAPEGEVLAQDPLPRQLARRGDTVEVTVSRGPEERAVPDVVGLTARQAFVVLRQAGFDPLGQRVDAEADVGEVVATRPEPGRRLELPAQVTVVVSAGPRIVTVPNLLTRSLTEARATLERLGLQLGRVWPDSSADAAPGTVLAQNPLPGATVPRGDSVSVSVAGAIEADGEAGISPPPPDDPPNEER